MVDRGRGTQGEYKLTAQQKRAGLWGLIHYAQQNPGPLNTFPYAYNVALPASPTYIQHIGTISRTAVKFDTGNTYIGSYPIAITFSFRKIGNPTGAIRTGIRKASDESFILIAEWPADYTRPGTINGIYTVTAEGGNSSYAIVANDKFSIEYTGTSATNGIEIAMNPQTANPTQTSTTQQYTGTYASAANALAATIKTRMQT
jgi:hypothetical protein